MSTPRINYNPALLQRVVAESLWGPSPFFLLDVGASGGVESHWQVFGSRLEAIGFEPLIAETARLNAQAAGTTIRYVPAFVTCRDYDALFPPDLREDLVGSRNNDVFERVSARAAQRLLGVHYAQDVFNAGAPAVYSETRVVLDEFVDAKLHPTVDFIKVDTDGHDIEVLLGAERMLDAGGVLGFSIEAQMHGASHDYANTFANIDRFMRRKGFTLYDLEIYRYSRAALPAPFVYDLAAQTETGQVVWGEAVYFRDLAHADYERMWPYAFTPERVLKLACLFELFGLPDCAAELLVERGAFLDASVKEALLGLLSPQGAYAAYIDAFRADPAMMYPSRRRAIEADARTAAPAAGDVAREEIAVLRRDAEALQARIAAVEEQITRRQA